VVLWILLNTICVLRPKHILSWVYLTIIIINLRILHRRVMIRINLLIHFHFLSFFFHLQYRSITFLVDFVWISIIIQSFLYILIDLLGLIEELRRVQLFFCVWCLFIIISTQWLILSISLFSIRAIIVDVFFIFKHLVCNFKNYMIILRKIFITIILFIIGLLLCNWNSLFFSNYEFLYIITV